MLGDESARIRLVAADRITEFTQSVLHRFRHDCDAGRAVAVAEHNIGARAIVARGGGGRH